MIPEQEASFTAFVVRDGDALLRYARLLFPDPHAAEDALQTTLLRTARHWTRGLDAPAAYVRTALRNLACDGSRRRHLVAVPTARPPVAPAEPDLADAHAAAEELDAILSTLPPRQRATVVLRIVDGLSEAETAAALGCAPGTVKSNLARGLARLREELADPRPHERSTR